MIKTMCCFQIFRLTAIVVKVPSEVHPVFTVSLDGVAIDPEKVKEAVACVQVFVRDPLFMQRNYSSETGISMLNTAINAADAVRHSSKFDPWGEIGVEAGPVVTDLMSCREKIISRKKAVKVTQERWFGAESVASSAVGEAAPRMTVRISYVSEMGDVQYVEEHSTFGYPCCSRSVSSPGKNKKRRVPLSPVVVEKQFSVESASASRPSFDAALEKTFEKSATRRKVRDCRTAPIFHGGYQ